MSGCSYVERRGSRYYFRTRIPLDLAVVTGRTHVVASLGTSDQRIAKIKSARFFFLLASFFATMHAKMANALNIDVNNDYCRQEILAASAFALGQEYEARREGLKQEFSVRLNQLIASIRDDITPLDASPPECASADGVISFVAARERITTPFGQANAVPTIPDVARAASSLLSWDSLRQAFLADKPGLSSKTIWSYNQAFDTWAELIGSKPIGDIRRHDVKAFADFLRDKENARGGGLHHKTIQRSLGHIKTFMIWAVAAGHATDDRFETVAGRAMTKEERLAGNRRRAITPLELIKLFRSELFTEPSDDSEVAAGWFLAIAALTGARTDEIASAPARLVLLGDFHCLDLREAGRKTSAAPRLIPLLPDLVKMGLLDWAAKQEALGYTLVQHGVAQRTAAAWSKWMNRYLNAKVTDDPELVLYSLRHSFRQMLRAGNIGDELSNKIFGHSTGEIGAEYGRALSPDEAQLFLNNVKPAVDLRHLWCRD